MKKILLYLTPDKHPSFYDIVLGYDFGADVVFPYPSLEKWEVKRIIYDAVFTREPQNLKNMGIFIGGDNFEKSQEIMQETLKALEKFSEKKRPSLILDPAGACTTASAVVAKIKSSLGNLSGKKAVILAGTGPVGQCCAFLFAKEKAKVAITSRKLEKAKRITGQLKEKFNIKVEPLQGSNLEEIKKAVKGAHIVLSTGPEGITLLPKKMWSSLGVKALGDVNSVPPLGIEGLRPEDDGKEREGKLCWGGDGIGKLKVKTHKKLLQRVFQKNSQVFDLEKIYHLTLEILDK